MWSLWSSLLLMFLLLPTWAHAATYWLSTSGSDSNGCNASTIPLTTTAKRSIKQGVACLANPGDTLKIRGGTYAETQVDFYNKYGGSWSTPFIIEAYNRVTEPVVWAGTGSIALNVLDVHFAIIRGITFDGTNGTNNLHGGGAGKTHPCCPVPHMEQLVSFACYDNSTVTTCKNTSPSDVRLENNYFHTASYIAVAASRYAHRIGFYSNEFFHIGQVDVAGATYIGGMETTFDGNYCHDISGGCFNLWMTPGREADNGPNLGLIINNRIERTGYFWAPTAQNGTPSPVDTGGTTRYSQGARLGLNPGIFISRGTGTQIYNNVVIDGTGGIEASHDAVNCLIANNSIYGNAGTGGSLSYQAGIALTDLSGGASNCIVRNNIIYQPGVTNPEPITNLGTNNTLDHNLCSSGVAGSGCTIITQTSPFVNAPTNLQLSAGSIAIDAGLTVGFSGGVDLLGVSRPQGVAFDLGAYEFVGGPVNTYEVTRSLGTVAGGSDITASWTVSPGPGQALDWIGLVLAGAIPQNYVTLDGEGNPAWTYTDALTSGNFTLAAPLSPGTYEFIYCINDTFNCPVRSQTFTVTAPPNPANFIVRTMRWHKADLAEAASPTDPDWLEGENTTISVKPGGKVRGRWSIGFEGSTPAADHYALYCTFDGSIWTRLSTSCASFPLCVGTDSAKNSGDVTANRLTLPAGYTFIAGYFEVDSINTALTVQPSNLQAFEVEYSIASSLTLAHVGDTAQCQPRHNDGTQLDNYLVNASLAFGAGAHRIMGKFMGVRLK